MLLWCLREERAGTNSEQSLLGLALSLTRHETPVRTKK